MILFPQKNRLFLAILVSAAAVSGATTEEVKARLRVQYGKLPLSFEENRGQVDGHVKYLTKGHDYSIWLTPGEVSFQVNQAAIRMRFAGAQGNPPVSGDGVQQALSSYFIGNDPAKWLSGIPNYARVRYSRLYPGIDLVLYGNRSELEYDFVVAPGADPKLIQLAFQGVERLRIDAAGDLILRTAAGEMRQHKPVVYQESDGGRQSIDGRYVLDGRTVRFQVARYDTDKPLIIDPTLSFLTYLGAPGQSGFDPVLGTYPAVALDASGDVYVVTTSTTGDTNVLVDKLNGMGSALLYSVNFGGSLADMGEAIAVDGPGNAYVTGVTSSTNFPVTPGAPQGSNHSTTGGNNAFVTKLNPTGGIVYSTYLGGTGDDFGRSIAIDSSGNAYVVGTAIELAGTNFPVTGGVLSSSPGPGFLTKVNSAGTGFAYSTFLSYGIAYGVVVDTSGDAFVTGTTGPSGGIGPAFVVSVNPTASGLNYGPVDIGDSGHQTIGYAIALDASRNAYVTGMTNDPALKIQGTFSVNGPQTTYGGGTTDAFAVKLTSSGNAVYATYIGGIGANNYPERGSGIGVDAAGNAYVAGTTECIGFPQVNTIPNAAGVRAPLSISTNHGASWTPVTGLMPPGNGIFDQVTALAFGPSGSNTVYAGTSAMNNGGSGGGVYKSSDGGVTWTLADSGIVNAASTFDAIAVNPSNVLDVFAVANGVIYESTNGGSNWSPSAGSPTVGSAASIAVGANSTVYVGSSSGLVVRMNGTWSTANTVPSPVNTVVVNPAATTDACAGTDNGLYCTLNSGATWGQYNTGLSGVSLIITSLAVDSLSDVFAATPAGVVEWKAGTPGFSAALPTNTVQTTTLVAVDPSNPMNLYVAVGGGGIVYSTNGGSSFSPVTLNGLTHNSILSLGVQPGTGTVFAGNTAATDAFAVKISSSGNSFVYATCIGGADNDLGQGIAVNAGGPVYVSGATASANLPVTANAYQKTLEDTYDAFVVALDVSSEITYPMPGTILEGSAIYFSWSAVTGATQYQLNVGTTPGGTNIFSGITTGTSQKVEYIPCTGGTVYVQVLAYVGGVWQPGLSYGYTCKSEIGDFNGDHHEDLIWQNISTLQTNVNYYDGSGPQAQGSAVLNTNASGWRVVGAADFNHDGVPDLVWQNTTTGQVNVNYYGGANHTTIIGYAVLNAGGPSTTGWSVVAVADQNGDGNPDLIWQNSSTGQVNVNYYGGAGGATLTGYAVLNAGGPSTAGWHVYADADFDGNGIPDLVWQNSSTGQVNVNYYGGSGGATLIGYAVLNNGANTAGWTLVGAADMNASGVPGLIWENNSTGQVNVNYYGGTGGAIFEGYNCLNCGTSFAGLTVRALADFNGNGEPDLIVQNNSTSAATVYYYGYGGAVFQGWALLNSGVGAAGWKLLGSGDFDGNGVPDLVWQYAPTGQVNVNYYGGAGGASLIGYAVLNNGSNTAGWSLVAIADFNGDGVPDLVWENNTTGQVNVNYYGGAGGASFIGYAVLNNGAGTAGWHVVAAADFDGNGTPDLVWQNNSTGQVNVNYYTGTTLTGYAVLNSGAGTAGWVVTGAADFDGNGTPDLVWQNTTSGQAVVDYYGGAKGSVLYGSNSFMSAAGWRVMPARSR